MRWAWHLILIACVINWEQGKGNHWITRSNLSYLLTERKGERKKSYNVFLFSAINPLTFSKVTHLMVLRGVTWRIVWSRFWGTCPVHVPVLFTQLWALLLSVPSLRVKEQVAKYFISQVKHASPLQLKKNKTKKKQITVSDGCAIRLINSLLARSRDPSERKWGRDQKDCLCVPYTYLLPAGYVEHGWLWWSELWMWRWGEKGGPVIYKCFIN